MVICSFVFTCFTSLALIAVPELPYQSFLYAGICRRIFRILELTWLVLFEQTYWCLCWNSISKLSALSWLQWKPLKAGHCLQRQTIWRVHRLSYRHLPAHLSHIALFLYQPTVLSKILLRQFDGVWLPDYLLFGLVCFASILSVVSDCIRLYLHLLFSCKRVLTLTSTVM